VPGAAGVGDVELADTFVELRALPNGGGWDGCEDERAGEAVGAILCVAPVLDGVAGELEGVLNFEDEVGVGEGAVSAYANGERDVVRADGWRDLFIVDSGE